MPAVLAFKHQTTQRDVEIAWATYRALILAEVDDPKLANDLAHQEAITKALDRYQQLFADWVG
jgi:hypothetical protein